MFDLTDILRQAQGGEAVRNLAQRFGLTTEQSQAAVEAMMPAFATALTRQMADPQAFQALARMMTGQVAAPRNPYVDAVAAFGPETLKTGNELLVAMFGSSEVTKAVAEQAAAISGVGRQVMQAMLPVVASIMMGGIGGGLRQDPLGDMVTRFFGGGAPPANGMEALRDMMGGLMRDSAEKAPAAFGDAMRLFIEALPRPTGGTETVGDFLKRAPNPAGPATLVDEAFGAFVRGFNRGRPEKKPEPPPPDDFGAVVDKLFQAGQDVQASQVQAFEQIFDRFWGPAKR
jgi:hypothetical protein